MSKIRLTVWRWKQSEDKLTTIGDLFLNDVKFCNTLEDKIRDEKVYGETCIPEGLYKCSITFSPKFKRNLILVHDVPGFKHIRVHSGNHKEHTLGCVLIGEAKSDTWISNSRKTENELMKIVSEYDEIELEIFNIIHRDDE